MSRKHKNEWWEDEENYYDSRKGWYDRSKKEYGKDWGDLDSYDYSFSQETHKKETTAWEDYQQTGIWRGTAYYQKSLVDYGYVEKMANAFGAKYNITVEAGQGWSADVKSKVLVYEPMSLMQYSKARIIALLLHEIGHIKYTSVHEDTDSPYLLKYKKLAKDVLNCFEDFRIDKIMAKSYAGAEDVYESNKPVVREIAENYTNNAKRLNDMVRSYSNRVASDKNMPVEEKEKKLAKLDELLKKKDNLWNYLSAIVCVAYDESVTMSSKIEEYVNKTKHTILEVQQQKTSYGVLSVLDNKVFPIIQDLMKDLADAIKEVGDIFGKEIAKLVSALVMRWIEDEGETYGEQKVGKNQIKTRVGAGKKDCVPQEWRDGDYNSLRDSVDSAIKELIRKLTFLKKEESVARYVTNQRRGKLNIKSLYKHIIPDFRLFKKKLEVKDTVRSFAFSLVLDKSGSMYGSSNRMIHSTRALILLAEVFNKMKIPYDISLFGSNCKKLKAFNESYTDKMKKNIGGVLTRGGDSSTILRTVFEKGIDLMKQPEKNKIMVIISDGDIGSGIESCHTQYMDKYVKQGVKFIGVGLNCGENIVKLCYSNGFNTKNPSQLPKLFSDMLKGIIFPSTKKQTTQTQLP
jgi:hypothetical protein